MLNTKPKPQSPTPAIYMRGGTSKGVFLNYPTYLSLVKPQARREIIF